MRSVRSESVSQSVINWKKEKKKTMIFSPFSVRAFFGGGPPMWRGVSGWLSMVGLAAGGIVNLHDVEFPISEL